MKKEDSIESYFEYVIKGIDGDLGDQIFYENATDYYGLDLKIKYSLDNNQMHSAYLDNNPAIMQDFLS